MLVPFPRMLLALRIARTRQDVATPEAQSQGPNQ
jgi:hypothetical protein